jgi:hypothetical protein
VITVGGLCDMFAEIIRGDELICGNAGHRSCFCDKRRRWAKAARSPG